VFGAFCGDTVTATRAVPAGTRDWVIAPPRPGRAVRVLVDFGRMLVGRHRLVVDAPAGAVIDLHGFEFIQPDGRHNWATGTNNTLRYVCRAGPQEFLSLQRRGFRYTWLVVRGLTQPLRVREFTAEISTSPQRRRGRFTCADPRLNRIWTVGADTLRWCAEDTYTDCPTYEQTNWVGDARNEALVDWIVNGDARLWRHNLLLAAQGLERFPLVPSHVPSTWENLLPAWSFLWMRSCREYLRWTGDRVGAAELLPWLARSVEGLAAHLTPAGFFRMKAWNLFDWAALETPADGVVTHVNCLAALALGDAAELATWLGHPRTARAWRRLAAGLRRAVNRELWDEATGAYVDCRHADGRPGAVRSQQTQAAALLAGVATGRRARRCREIVAQAPEGFVSAGSPFFVFFLLEILAAEGDGAAVLERIRRDWGFMVEQGATSFWELWTLSRGRLTRSHCHGWSAAPTFFLSTTILGVSPGAPGSREIYFSPQPGDLVSLSGRMPTPWGWVEVRGRREGGRWRYDVRVPRGCRLRTPRRLRAGLIVAERCTVTPGKDRSGSN
jgi:alpha-L-rhamnosidase